MRNLVLLSLVVSAFMSSPAMSADYFFLKAKHSNKCAQVDGASGANGGNISQWDCVNQDNVKWQKRNAGGGYVYLRAKHSGKCAQVDGASKANSANISQWDCVNQANVHWMLTPAEGDAGYYFIVNRASGKCMQVDGASRANGANITFTDGRRLFLGGSNPDDPTREGK